jgi:hypothetical protein
MARNVYNTSMVATSTTWSLPHISKIYEALGAIADGRVEILVDSASAKVFSSSKGKFYTVTWSADFSEMMANDNSAFWQNKLSYPMIAVLLLQDKLPLQQELSQLLAGIKWKDINQKFKNDFDATVEFVLTKIESKGLDAAALKSYVENLQAQISKLNISQFGKKVRPPQGY